MQDLEARLKILSELELEVFAELFRLVYHRQPLPPEWKELCEGISHSDFIDLAYKRLGIFPSNGKE